MLDGSAEALAILADWQSILLLLLGTAVGAAAAILPGISAVTVMALLLVVAAGMEKYDAFVLLVTIMAASGFAGSITSILLNVPGDGINAATCLDGFPLARRGRAGVAIGASATASGLGALIGLGLLILTLPIQRTLVLAIGPSEIFALTVMGIALVGVVSGRSPIRGIISALIGMLLGLVGVSLVVGGERFTLGILPLYDGIPLTAALIGLFAIPELVQLLRTNEAISQVGYTVQGGVLEGVKAVLTRPVLLIRSSLIGSFVGMVPGPGGSVASWMAYYTAQRISKHPETFGSGNIEGVIAPEASIDAKEGGSLIPVFILGLPGSVTAALLVAAFQFHGILPGATLFRDEAPLIWVMIFGMVAANLLTSVTGLALSNIFVRITLIPAVFIAPVVLALGFTGAYAEGTALFGVLMVFVAGVAGLGLERLGYPRPPLLIGMILIPLAESNFHQALQLNRGSYEFLLRPLTLSIFALTLIGMFGPAMYRWARRSRAADAPVPDVDRAIEEATPPVPVYPRPEVAFLAGVLVVLVAMLVGVAQLQPRAMIFPLVVIVPTAFLVTARLVYLVRGPLRERATATPTEEDGKRPYWQIIAWISVLPVLIWLLGIKLAIAVYIPVFMVFFEKGGRTPGRIAIAVLLTTGIILMLYFTFEQFLGVNFRPGVLGL